MGPTQDSGYHAYYPVERTGQGMSSEWCNHSHDFKRLLSVFFIQCVLKVVQRGDKPFLMDLNSKTSVCIKAEAVDSATFVRFVHRGNWNPFSKCNLTLGSRLLKPGID